MMRKRLIKLSIISFIIAVVLFAIDYLIFHHLTDAGFVLQHQQEAGKPFVTDLVGQVAASFFFLGGASLLVGFICFDKE
ncbi:MAG: hypothetical protein IKC33_00560 [Clostridia bacterium]|nr:hypothetical protein [Clostridia bacterium]MBQ4586963.1 hypothetical protein [Clostridia bacterium]MBR2932784.1 hypothetical protein [Clostridia bacterium]MBR6687769.1 hypothetical protein [Clostridia bacterium]